MDAGMSVGFEGSKKVFVKSYVTVKTGGRRTTTDLLSCLGGRHIPREENAEADALANLGSSTEMKGSNSSKVVQLMHSALEADSYFEVNTTNLVLDWRNNIIDYLEHGKLPEDPKASRALRTKAARYSFKGVAKVTKLLEDLKIKRITLSPYHPSLNGQEESTNKMIIRNLKRRLESAKGKWHEELPDILRAYRTTSKSSTGETHFSLVYEAEALIPVEVGESTLRYFRENKEGNNEAVLVNLELLDERRDLAHIRMVAQKQRVERQSKGQPPLFQSRRIDFKECNSENPRAQCGETRENHASLHR
nr:uncharacterized protein LOC117276387 [Nicotiana tomentosiformis]